MSWLKRLYHPHTVIAALVITLFWTQFNLEVWKYPKRVIAWDTISYYEYLPAAFIYKDLGLEYAKYAPPEVADKTWSATAPNGNQVIKTSMGVSVMYAPFFFVGHAIAKSSPNIPATGYSMPYRIMLALSAAFYMILGLWLLKKTLSRYFSNGVVSSVLILVLIGTNLFYYTTVESTMSHSYSFVLFAAFVYFTIKWYEKLNWQYTIALGLLTGLIVLIRPTNLLIVLLLAGWNIRSFGGIWERIKLLLGKWPYILLMVFCALLVWVPQIAYYKHITGQWLYYSYDNEHFFFNDPYILSGLFSYRKGWFLYTPIMLFAVMGVFFLRNKANEWKWPIAVFLVLNVYVILSWWCWWYGGSYGLRAFIESYAILAIPLGAFLQYVSRQRRYIKIPVAVVLIFLLFLSQFQTYQYRHEIIHYDGMNQKTYWMMFLRTEQPPGFWESLTPPNYPAYQNRDKENMN